LISLDTLRADHIGVYGYHRNTSPSIDAFAKESIVFGNAVVQSQWTLPSHMSIMTSLYPSSHGVTKPKDHLADEHVTLAELLREGGYQTAAFVDGGYMRGSFGFNQGFDIYDDSQGGGIKLILPKVKKWLDENKKNPFFLFIHCYDIHAPYDPPPPYDNIFHDFTYTGDLFPNNETLFLALWRGLKVNNEDLRHFTALYDGGIRYTDEKIGEFLSYLRDSGLEDQSLIIITSDHGEEFKEHGRLGHGQLYYRPNLHVPLIIQIPNYPKKEARISELVQSIDLLPTILEVAGLPNHPSAQGRNLLPLIKRKKNFFNYFLWKIFHPLKKDSHTSFSMEPRNNLYSIIAEGYQLIHNLNSNSIKLFNLNDDPLAKNNIANNHDDTVKRLLPELKESYSAVPIHKASTISLDEQTREQLKALGYINDPAVNLKDEQLKVPGYIDNPVITVNDDDFDGIPDEKDNCLNCPNPNQEDQDNDGLGNFCDNCPDIPNPDQIDSNKNGFGDACEHSSIEEHWMEAEDADTIVSPFEVANDENASKGKYIYAAEGTESQYTPGSIMATYQVTISKPGKYILQGRVIASNKKADSFFVQIDNGLNYLWEVETGDRWHWEEVNNRDRVNPVVFNLAEGVHTVKVKLREDGTKLDKMLLTNNILPILMKKQRDVRD
jgi:arylsulfatase A-like enzyme